MITREFQRGASSHCKFDKDPTLLPYSEILSTGSKFGYAVRDRDFYYRTTLYPGRRFSEVWPRKIEVNYGYINREKGLTVIDFIFDHAESFYMKGCCMFQRNGGLLDPLKYRRE
jgi:hypothetical protein